VALIRFDGVPSDDNADTEAYFRGRSRRMQFIVQGRFKEELNVADVLTGHEFDKPFQRLPPSWILSAGMSLIRRLAPGIVADLNAVKPKFLVNLAASIQSMCIDPMPGNEPDIRSFDIQEDCSAMGGIFRSSAISSAKRKQLLSVPSKAKQYKYDTRSVYTFDFYQHLIDVSTYSLDIGITKLGLPHSLNNQPIQCMAKTSDDRYLWNFLMWHESLLPTKKQ